MPIPATVECDALVPTGIALLDVATQGHGAALLDGTHDAALPAAQCRVMVFTVGRADLTKYIRHLKPDRAHRLPSEMNLRIDSRLRRICLGQQIERADRRTHGAGGDLQTARRSGQAAMSQ